MKIKLGLNVKDNKYAEERIYRIVGIDDNSVIPVVFLKVGKLEKLGKFELKKIRTPKKTFWDRFSLIGAKNERN